MHLDETYHFIISVFVERGQAPHFTEIAAHFGIPAAEGRKRLHELMAARLPNWLFPDTDLIASFAPFNNLPTQYRISVDGQQRWFAQCGFESLATTEAGLLTLADAMRVMSTPRHRDRLRPDYGSKLPEEPNPAASRPRRPTRVGEQEGAPGWWCGADGSTRWRRPRASPEPR